MWEDREGSGRGLEGGGMESEGMDKVVWFVDDPELEKGMRSTLGTVRLRMTRCAACELGTSLVYRLR